MCVEKFGATFALDYIWIIIWQAISVLCDRNALEIARYGAPKRFPDTPKMVLIQAMCGRG